MVPKEKKEKVILLINVGMKESLLTKAKLVARQKIENMIFITPQDKIAVVLMNSGSTKNELDAEHIEEFIRFQAPTWDCIRKTIDLESKDYHCNWVEAVEASVQYAAKDVDEGKDIFEKKIMLMSDFNEDEDVISQFDSKTIANRLFEQGIRLIALTDESLDERPAKSLTTSEVLLKDVCTEIDAQYTTFDHAISLTRYHIKTTKGSPVHFNLELVDIKIPITCFVRIARGKIPKLKQTVFKKQAKRKTHYLDRTKNASAKDEVVRGLKYGGTFIPLEEELQEQMSYKSGERSYRVHSFVNRDKVDLDYLDAFGNYIVLPRSENVAEQFYSLVKAMHNTNSVAIVRKVSSSNNVPRMVVLFPCIDVPDEPWCLIEIQLAFEEDRRVIKPRSTKSNLTRLSDGQNEALDDLIDSLTLPDVEDSYEVDGREQFLPGSVPDPTIQHFYHVLSSRALDPEKPLQKMDEVVGNLLMKERDSQNLKRVSQLFRLNENIRSRSNTRGKGRKDSSSKVNGSKKEVETNESVESDIKVPVLKADVMDVELDELAANI